MDLMLHPRTGLEMADSGRCGLLEAAAEPSVECVLKVDHVSPCRASDQCA